MSVTKTQAILIKVRDSAKLINIQVISFPDSSDPYPNNYAKLPQLNSTVLSPYILGLLMSPPKKVFSPPNKKNYAFFVNGWFISLLFFSFFSFWWKTRASKSSKGPLALSKTTRYCHKPIIFETSHEPLFWIWLRSESLPIKLNSCEDCYITPIISLNSFSTLSFPKYELIISIQPTNQ